MYNVLPLHSSQNSNVNNILPDLDTNLSIVSKIYRTLPFNQIWKIRLKKYISNLCNFEITMRPKCWWIHNWNIQFQEVENFGNIPKKLHLHRSPAIAHAYQRTIKASKTNLCPNIFQCRCSFLPIGYIYDFNIGYSWQLSWIKLDQACWVAFWPRYVVYGLTSYFVLPSLSAFVFPGNFLETVCLGMYPRLNPFSEGTFLVLKVSKSQKQIISYPKKPTTYI